MNISNRDLNKLAVLSTKIVNSISFPETGRTDKHCEMALRLIEKLESKYAKTGLLQSIKDAVLNLSDDTQNFYIVTRGLIRMVNKPFDFENANWNKLSTPVSVIDTSPSAMVACA